MAFSSRACMAETSWRRSPITATGGDGSCSTISMPRWSAVARTRSMASAMTRFTRTGSRGGASSDSMRDRSSRSSMMRLTRKASLWMRPARRWATSGSGSDTSVSASRPSAPIGVLSSWLDVGHEVAADLLEAPALGDVLDERDHPERPASVVDLAGAHLQRAPRRAVEVERALGRSLVPGVLEDLGHRLGGEGVAVAADHQGIGAPVAVDHGAVLVAQDDALGERVERAPEPDGVGAGLGRPPGPPRPSPAPGRPATSRCCTRPRADRARAGCRARPAAGRWPGVPTAVPGRAATSPTRTQTATTAARRRISCVLLRLISPGALNGTPPI